MPMIWLLLIVVFVVAEAVTYGLTTIWFAGGALVGAILAFLGYELMIQIIVFFAVSVFLLIVTRPLALRFMKRDKPKSSVNSVVGKKAIVVEKIDNRAQKGKVRIYDVDWLAGTASDDETVEEGTVVTVKEIHGVRLTVEQ